MINFKKIFSKLVSKKQSFPPLATEMQTIEPGILAYQVSDIVAANQQLIDRICGTTRYHKDHFQQWYMPIILKYIHYVHLLPASQNHHHRGTGGLLVHGLESGFYALDIITNHDVRKRASKEGQARHIAAPRWELSCFILGLAHDLGKVITDMIVHCPKLNKTWNPHEMSLTKWLSQHKIERYQVKFILGRGNKHELLAANLISDWLMCDKTKAYLREGDPELLTDMHLTFIESKDYHVFRDYVLRADQRSVSRYLSTAPHVNSPATSAGMAIHEHLTLAIQRLLADGIWGINVPGEVVWCINGQLYLVWPRAATDISNELAKLHVPGLPRNPEEISKTLMEWGVIVPYPADGQNIPYWSIAPDSLHQKGIKTNLRAVRLNNQTNWISPLPPSVPGDICTTVEESSEQESVCSIPTETEQRNPVVNEFHQLLQSFDPPFPVQVISQQTYALKTDAEAWFVGKGVSRVKVLQFIKNGDLVLLNREGQAPLIGCTIR